MTRNNADQQSNSASQETSPSALNSRTCPKCGFELDSADKFCPGCGSPLESDTKLCSECTVPDDPTDPFCPNCREEPQPKANKSGNKHRKYWISILCVLAVAAAAGAAVYILSEQKGNEAKTAEVSLKSMDKIEDPVSYTSKTAWYKVLTPISFFSVPFQEDGKLGNLVQGETVCITRLAGKDDSHDIWGQTENGWVLIEGSGTANLEEIVMSQDSSVYGDYVALSSAYIYSSPYESEVTDNQVNNGETVSLSRGMKDQFGTIWGKISSGKWVILEAGSEARFEKAEAAQDDPSDIPSEEPSTTYIIHNYSDSDVPETDTAKTDSNSQADQSENSGSDSAANTNQTSSYILADSNTRYYSESELMALDSKTLSYARNEIYARHGRLFRSSELQNYFNSQSWYHGTIDPDDFDANHGGDLSVIETENAKLMLEVEKHKGKYNLD